MSGTATRLTTPGTSARLPILVGVLTGMIVWEVVASSPAFDHLGELIFNKARKALFATPGFYCIHRTMLLALCFAGGSCGVFYSSMRRRNAILFLAGLIAVVAVFAALFPG
jgi:uncharacterized membrane protein